MTYTRGQRHALRMRVVNGELRYRQVRLRTDFVANADTALARLQQGGSVWVLQRGPLVTEIQQRWKAQQERLNHEQAIDTTCPPESASDKKH